MSITINHVSHRYGVTQVLQDVSLDIEAGEVVCLLGPSGSGKSTLLRIVAGLEPLQTGSLSLGELAIDPGKTVPTEDRCIGLVFQDHALFPHMTVAENIAFGMDDDTPPDQMSLLLKNVDLDGFSERYPGTMSGGQQQRVALVRALASEPVAMLMDEPFASVDRALRQSLREDARQLLKSRQIPTVFVTHDPEEAMLVADRIACMVDGRIVQVGTPEELWRQPRHAFVALAIANAQRIKGRGGDGKISTHFGSFAGDVSGEVDVCIRQGGVSIQPGGAARLEEIRFLNGEYVSIIRGGNEQLLIHSPESPTLQPGETVEMVFESDLIEVYPCDPQ